MLRWAAGSPCPPMACCKLLNPPASSGVDVLPVSEKQFIRYYQATRVVTVETEPLINIAGGERFKTNVSPRASPDPAPYKHLPPHIAL